VTGPLVTMQHVRAHDVCVPVAREFCRRHGLVREGLPPEQLEATGDGVATAIAATAREDHRGRR
jgi:hypothetical protein